MRVATSLFITSLVALSVNAATLLLVSQEEMLQSNATNLSFTAKIAPPPDAPIIDLITPKLDGPITSPTPILLRFLPKEPSKVKPDSFKAYYGSFQIDITSRLLAIAQVSPQGINLKEASLPKGNHKILFNVDDSDGRQGSKLVEFEVK